MDTADFINDTGLASGGAIVNLGSLNVKNRDFSLNEAFE